ncbi:HAD family hydrolase [Anoxybacteroides rupiense]|uniref:HAD family hydrolase n=1 Tax=Anoxybacteroides rupiense TaxID=311460 RepID=UPI0016061651|nr:HAD family hydrolase [Anoxybacillus rupiensis]MBB3908598.1 putative hydrolase of the HAD superfamily [Anoxybacillus rupiensis]
MYIGYIFDLDDTLYCEHDFVTSGFRAVAKELACYRSDMSVGAIQEMLIAEWKKNGRGKVFNEICKRLDVDIDIAHLVHIYRTHHPDISLYEDAKEFISFLKEKGKILGIITDGHSTMQWTKVEALNLESMFDYIIVTGDLGDEHWKPSETPYRKMVEYLNLDFKDCVYIGDNPHKDFITARKLGMGTIRIIRNIGDHMRTRLAKEYEADHVIDSLSELMDRVE